MAKRKNRNEKKWMQLSRLHTFNLLFSVHVLFNFLLTNNSITKFRITRLLESHNFFSLKKEGLIVLSSFRVPQPQMSISLLSFVCLLLFFLLFVCLFCFVLFCFFLFVREHKNVASLNCLRHHRGLFLTQSSLSDSFFFAQRR